MNLLPSTTYLAAKLALSALLLLVALFYILHVRRELAHIWRRLRQLDAELRAKGRHFERLIRAFVALALTFVLLSPCLHALFEWGQTAGMIDLA